MRRSNAALPCVLLCILGCGAESQDHTTRGAAGASVSPLPGAEGVSQPVNPASTEGASNWSEAVSQDAIEGEAFSTIWGTDDDLWVVGGRTPGPVVSEPSTDILICGDDRWNASVIIRRKQGLEWQTVEHPIQRAVTAIHGTGSDNVWTIGLAGAAFHFDGTAWTDHSADLRAAAQVDLDEPCYEVSLSGVFSLGPNDTWAVGYANPSELGAALVLHYDGTSWARHAVDARDSIFDVWAASPDDVWAVGASGALLHYDGIEWISVNAQTNHYLRSIFGTSSSDVWASGNTAVLTHYDGSSWQLEQASIPFGDSSALAGNTSGELWTLRTLRSQTGFERQSVLRRERNEWVEISHSLDENDLISDLWVTPDGQVWAAGKTLTRFR